MMHVRDDDGSQTLDQSVGIIHNADLVRLKFLSIEISLSEEFQCFAD